MKTTKTFLDWHKPSLSVGDYTIKVEQLIAAGSFVLSQDQTLKFIPDPLPSKIPLEKFPPTTRHFSVLGPRFTLNPQEIQEMFPPPGSLGEHSNVLPHIILKRSTLPWERLAQHDDSSVPWLALLLFEEPEIPVEKISKLSELKDPLANLDKGDHGDDQVNVIHVPKKTLERLIPTADELKYLAHVRQKEVTKEGQKEVTKEEVAVVIGNRLPTPGRMSIVHLVSLENRYSVVGKFDYKNATLECKIPLVSLKSWRFACVSAKQSFKGLLTHLNHQLLFHFRAPVTDPTLIKTLIKTLNGGSIPREVRSAFEQNARPLADQTRVSEHSQWRIVDPGNRYYLVSNKKNVFNQAGKKLFTFTSDTDPDGQKLSDHILPQFAQAKHKLDDKKATLEKQPQADHWWIEDSNKHYFISREAIREVSAVIGEIPPSSAIKEILYVYDLDPHGSSTLRLPPSTNKQVEEYLKRGCVALPHAMRQGKQTVSWYHGPLRPGSKTTSDDVELPIRSADELWRYNKGDGMLDVSYAAAWELGRLLTLQKTQVAVDLFNWKRGHAQESHIAETHPAYLPYEKAKTDLELPPQTVKKWFADLACFRGVPFAYLVPDERMLPLESIRFFRVDRRWVECLLDGAFGIGPVIGKDHRRDQVHVKEKAESLFQTGHEMVTGFLLRSDVVSGWPGLLADGYADTEALTPLTPLCPPERLSKNVLLCLFDGNVKAVDIHQRPETLHFGFNRPDPSNSDYYKEKDATNIGIVWKNKDLRVVDIGELAGAVKLKSRHSAQFASDMIEGVERVRFQLGARAT